MRDICVCGLGAVSPAGWGIAALRNALASGLALPTQPLARPGWDKPLRTRAVPVPSPPLAFFTHPRLRRASPITHYAVGAGLEALTMAGAVGTAQPARLGLVMCMLAGCVHYSHRFFDETLKDPATASPLLFPETVFNAPTSHMAALLEKPPVTCTLLGDPATFLEGLALAADWLLAGRVDGCLVVGAEETNWLLADALWSFDHHGVLASGAGAIYLTCLPAGPPGIVLSLITDVESCSTRQSRAQSLQRVRQALPVGAFDELLCDSAQGRPQTDAAERAAWRDWPGQRLSPKLILGEGLMAAGAWQCVAACDMLTQHPLNAAVVSVGGANQRAVGARFVRSGN